MREHLATRMLIDRFTRETLDSLVGKTITAVEWASTVDEGEYVYKAMLIFGDGKTISFTSESQDDGCVFPLEVFEDVGP